MEIMEIKQTYVTFQQAKLLREKGFDEPCDSIFKEDGEFQSYKRYGDIRTHFKSNESINPKTWHRGDTLAPEQWQVIEWLEESKFYIVEAYYNTLAGCKWQYYIIDKRNNHITDNGKQFNSRKEAYSAAIDYCLKQLI